MAKQEADPIKKVLEEIEKQKKEAEKEKRKFTAPDEEQLKKKLTRLNSPMVYFQSWGDASPGGSVNYSVGIYNPDPIRRSWLFVHVFVGPANMVPGVNEALATVDERFPRLTLPDFDGLSVDPGDTETLSFALPVPANIERSNYLGNSFLFRADWHDVGDYIDRGVFVFEVV